MKRASIVVGMLAGLVTLALTPVSARADDASLLQAKAHFKTGVTLLSDKEGPRYEEAYAEFKQAFQLSNSPNVLGNLGLCAMKLERDGEAVDNYTRYLAEVHDIDKEERKQIQQDLETLRASAAHLEIFVDDPHLGATSLIDSRIPVSGPTFTNAYAFEGASLHLLIRPGHHLVKLKPANGPMLEWDFDATPAGEFSHHFAQTPKSEKARTEPVAHASPSLVGPAVLMGIGAAGLAVGGILGGVTLSKVHALDQDCPNGNCRKADAQGRIDDAHHFVRATDFTLLGGGLVATAGLSWLVATIVERRGAAHAAPNGAPQSFHAEVTFDPRGGFATWGTRF